MRNREERIKKNYLLLEGRALALPPSPFCFPILFSHKQKRSRFCNHRERETAKTGESAAKLN